MAGTSSAGPDSFDQLGRALSEFVGTADVIEPHRLIELVDRCAATLGSESASVWLIDHQQRTLVHLAVDDGQDRQPVEGTVAGRAFATSEVVQVDDGDRTCLWIPLLAGVDRTGVLEVVTAGDAPNITMLRNFAAVVAAEIVASNLSTDLFTRTRRQRALSLAAELQWAALPPLSFATDAVHVAGMVEPAYEVGGDIFDYAHAKGLLSFAILDAVGHSLASSMISTLALGAYRNRRRNDGTLEEMATAIDGVLEEQFDPACFATGQLATLDTVTGTMRWINAGHPLPLLIRRGRVIGHLECAPRPPFGLAALARGAAPQIAVQQLEPGDAVLLYSDGVIERRTGGGLDYGIERLEEFLQTAFAAQMSPAETLRRLANAILDFHEGQLEDDATTILVAWRHGE